jgi:glycosyltransferase involved in cell wall biosynthesis
LASSSAVRSPKPRRVVFPGPTIARKGAYELREAARELDLEVMPLGRALEGADFWQGLRLAARAEGSTAWLDQAAAIVQPAFVEDQPRPLLRALATGVPVVATPACGIAPRPGLTLVPAGDAAALARALARVLNL